MKGIIEPITLEQLREMNGKPVYDWIGQQWFVIDGVFVKGNLKDSEFYYAEITMSDGTVFCSDLNYDGISGRFYVYPPANIDRQVWVSVNEQMPDEHDSIFKKLIAKEKWGAGMFERLSDDVIVAVKFADGTRRSGFAHTKDGVWVGLPSIGCPVVTHWIPLPEPPEEEYERFGVSAERLVELAQANQTELAKVLPCKVGDTVYTNVYLGDRYRKTDKLYPVKVVFIEMGEHSAYFHVAYDNGRWFRFDFDQIGKDVFLTPEAAEAILEKEAYEDSN